MEDKTKKEIKLLKEYFKKIPNVSMAFVFGSKAEGLERGISDWDVAVYFSPRGYLELETESEYEGENKIWSDLVDILATDNVDFIVLNRSPPELVFSILNTGIPLVVKNKVLYQELLSKTHYEAIDFREFAFEYNDIYEKATSLNKKDKFRVLKRLNFLDKEWQEFKKFKGLT